MEKSKKILLAVENDREITNADQHRLKKFMRKFNGEVREMTSLFQKSSEEIFKAVNEATDIACQTVFVQQSHDMLFEMARILSKIPESKNIWIAYGNDLEEKLRRELSDKEFYAIKQHNIHYIGNNWNEDGKDISKLIDFSDIVEREQHRLDEIIRIAKELRLHKLSLETNITGRKVKIKSVEANSPEFKNLIEGSIVDEIDASSIDPSPNRGIWVWGITEPVKLLNEGPYREYEVLVENDLVSAVDEILQRVGKPTGSMRDISSLLKDEEESPISIGNYICEQFDIPKRGNRRVIADIVIAYRGKKEEVLCNA